MKPSGFTLWLSGFAYGSWLTLITKGTDSGMGSDPEGFIWSLCLRACDSFSVSDFADHLWYLPGILLPRFCPEACGRERQR